MAPYYCYCYEFNRITIAITITNTNTNQEISASRLTSKPTGAKQKDGVKQNFGENPLGGKLRYDILRLLRDILFFFIYTQATDPRRFVGPQ